MDRLPHRINSLRIQQQKFCRDTEMAIVKVHVDLFVGGTEEDSLPETTSSKLLASQMGLSDAGVTTNKLVGDNI